MVGHQDVSVNLEVVPLPVVFNSFQVAKPVSIVAKDSLTLIATDDDMVKSPFEFYAWFSRHAGEYSRTIADKSILMPDPSPTHEALCDHRSTEIKRLMRSCGSVTISARTR
jgi:hypothetical protein